MTLLLFYFQVCYLPDHHDNNPTRRSSSSSGSRVQWRGWSRYRCRALPVAACPSVCLCVCQSASSGSRSRESAREGLLMIPMWTCHRPLSCDSVNSSSEEDDAEAFEESAGRVPSSVLLHQESTRRVEELHQRFWCLDQPSGCTMVKTFQAYLPNQCHRTYSCVHCRAHLANHDELISKVRN